ncbi:hypothetical protein [Curtobacterium poinsettiae]|uniref:hypothetical protein n=1 Tax=Curtobacterium poinsettiae TaxID=159612 RepID=UPI00217E34E4|nr:hypothetical protein [Curtobacterium flaccumfaciens]MCS6578215.1 hypothetical protein [Curtobacterium flaccumfaciens]
MTEQKYRAVVRTADGRQMYGTLTDIQSAREEITATFTEDHIERPVQDTEQPHLQKTLLAIHLEGTAAGTHMAAADVDPDGTARIELVERRDVGWVNLTLDGEETTSLDIAQRFDDVVVTRLPEPSLPTREQIAEAARAVAASYEAVSRIGSEPLFTPDSDMPESIADAVLALLQKGADRG